MSKAHLSRGSLCKSLFTLPVALVAQSQLMSPSPGVAKVAAGADRSNNVIKLPRGDLVYVKVATRDSEGALFVTEQPIARRGIGPPKHYHEAQDEWFYCLAGEYVVEIGDKRFRLAAGDSVLGPRCVPHAFVYDSAGPRRLLVAFTPAGHIEQFFRELERRGQYFGNGTPEDKEIARREYGIVNVGPPLTL
jgi:quercetin dioxygenase-like cupin family protein